MFNISFDLLCSLANNGFLSMTSNNGMFIFFQCHYLYLIGCKNFLRSILSYYEFRRCVQHLQCKEDSRFGLPLFSTGKLLLVASMLATSFSFYMLDNVYAQAISLMDLYGTTSQLSWHRVIWIFYFPMNKLGDVWPIFWLFYFEACISFSFSFLWNISKLTEALKVCT